MGIYVLTLCVLNLFDNLMQIKEANDAARHLAALFLMGKDIELRTKLKDTLYFLFQAVCSVFYCLVMLFAVDNCV